MSFPSSELPLQWGSPLTRFPSSEVLLYWCCPLVKFYLWKGLEIFFPTWGIRKESSVQTAVTMTFHIQTLGSDILIFPNYETEEIKYMSYWDIRLSRWWSPGTLLGYYNREKSSINIMLSLGCNVLFKYLMLHIHQQMKVIS